MLYLCIIGFQVGNTYKIGPHMTSSWKIKKEKLKQKFDRINDKDLVYKIGHEWDMVKKLKVKLEKSTKELLSIFIEF